MKITAKQARENVQGSELHARTKEAAAKIIADLEEKIEEASKAGKLELTVKSSFDDIDPRDPMTFLFHPEICSGEKASTLCKPKSYLESVSVDWGKLLQPKSCLKSVSVDTELLHHIVHNELEEAGFREDWRYDAETISWTISWGRNS